MVKPRKVKADGDKGENLCYSSIRNQKICLSIDMKKQLLYGFTEMEVLIPENGIVGIHAGNLEIEQVLVDGESTSFDFSSHFHVSDLDNMCGSLSTLDSAADAAISAYISALDREKSPNLFIHCRKPNSDEVIPQSNEWKSTFRLIRVVYWIQNPKSGIHFDGDVLVTHNQIRRAKCWFPCIDEASSRCSYDMEFTVADHLVAVSTGDLISQVLCRGDSSRKTYVYRLNVHVTSQDIGLVVAPFRILSGFQNSIISHMCLPSQFSILKNNVDFLCTAFNHIEDYLSASFPFGSYKQVFIPAEMAVSSSNIGASMSIFSSNVLFEEKVVNHTIDTRVKLAYALSRQWFGVYITGESSADDWLLEGLAGFLTDLFIKRFLGNNEARYSRYKANCVVSLNDHSGATSLSRSPGSPQDMNMTHCIGFYGKIRVWKSVAVLQMLEKQIGPDSFRKILQVLMRRAQDSIRPLRTISTKEFRHLANKVGNLERPFLKEFFPRWIESYGCLTLRIGVSYNKRKNIVELAFCRGYSSSVDQPHHDGENREVDSGCPGMMSIRVHELDGMYDHPIVPVSGDPWQLLEIPCHSRIAPKRFNKLKKGSKLDGSDDNGDATLPLEGRLSTTDSPLLWLRADPEMEYLADIHFRQPLQMWVTQLENDKDVVAQSQAISALQSLQHIPSVVSSALNNLLCDSKTFWRVRIDAAFALATTSTEETDWVGFLHLIRFYKGRRFDPSTGLPKPNDFRDISEYFVLEAIPHAVASVRTSCRKSPIEAVEFILQLFKYNDNSRNAYSDVFWISSLVLSVGQLEFGQENISLFPSLLKHLERVLQFDRLMPVCNGLLTISCIRALTQIALASFRAISMERFCELIESFRSPKMDWNVRVEASKAMLDLEWCSRGIDSTLLLFMRYVKEETSLRGQTKLGKHVFNLCEIYKMSDRDELRNQTWISLLRFLESQLVFNNIYLRHNVFCTFQILAGRRPTLFRVSKEVKDDVVEAPNQVDLLPVLHEDAAVAHTVPPPKPTETISNSLEKKIPVVRIRVKQSTEDKDRLDIERSHFAPNEIEQGVSSSASVHVMQRNWVEEVCSCGRNGSKMTASVSSVKQMLDSVDYGKEVQCTAESCRDGPRLQFGEEGKGKRKREHHHRKGGVDPETSYFEVQRHKKKKRKGTNSMVHQVGANTLPADPNSNWITSHTNRVDGWAQSNPVGNLKVDLNEESMGKFAYDHGRIEAPNPSVNVWGKEAGSRIVVAPPVQPMHLKSDTSESFSGHKLHIKIKNRTS